jgi:WD40 repeat protein
MRIYLISFLFYLFSDAQSHILKGHSAPVKSISFNCDGSLLLSASDDKTVKVNLLLSSKVISFCRFGQLVTKSFYKHLKVIRIGLERPPSHLIQE